MSVHSEVYTARGSVMLRLHRCSKGHFSDYPEATAIIALLEGPYRFPDDAEKSVAILMAVKGAMQGTQVSLNDLAFAEDGRLLVFKGAQHPTMDELRRVADAVGPALVGLYG
jgi:hypothetical protein